MKVDAGDEFFEPDMPDPGSAEYLLAHLWAIGPTMGDSPITSGEIRDYQQNMGITLNPWECATLRRLSIDCMAESQRAAKPDCPPPFAESNDAIRLRIAEHERDMDLFLS